MFYCVVQRRGGGREREEGRRGERRRRRREKESRKKGNELLVLNYGWRKVRLFVQKICIVSREMGLYEFYRVYYE